MSRLLPVLLLAAGALLRLWASGLARFTGDESHQWYVALKMATFERFPVYGLAITGTEANLPGALCYYLIALPQLFGATPRLGAISVALGHVAVGWLLYRVLRDARGERAALFGLALAMFSPWEVLYADRIWGSTLVPIFGAVAIYAAVQAKESAAWQGALIAVNLVMVQLHLSAPILWVACGVIVLLRRPTQWSKKAILVGLGVTLIAYSPMLIAEIGSGFANTRMILSKAGGEAPWSQVAQTPVRMLGYAIMYGSGELSYHFARGYWGGYDDAARYLTATGWRTWFGSEGIGIATWVLVSLAVAFGAWVTTLADLGGALKERKLDLSHVVTLGLLAGLVAGTALMMLAKKQFFPHYPNGLMPMLLWPVAIGLDLWKRPLAEAALALSVSAMVFNTMRYYEEIDSLNGLETTLQMVDAALKEDQPIDVRFEHFNNGHAWNLVARGIYEQTLPMDRGALVRWHVKNRAPHRGEVPPGHRRFGNVLVRRTERARPKPAHLTFRATERWREIEVRGPGASCKATTGRACRFGEQEWLAMRPRGFEMRGKPALLLFLHPIAKETVTAKIPIPLDRSVKGTLLFGLSDQAHQSSNDAPVEVRLFQGEALLAETKTGGRGLERLPIALTATGADSLELRITTDDDGARVFGFDLDLTGE